MLRMKAFHTNESAILITFVIINDVAELKLQFHILRLKHYIAARLKKPKGLNKQKDVHLVSVIHKHEKGSSRWSVSHSNSG